MAKFQIPLVMAMTLRAMANYNFKYSIKRMEQIKCSFFIKGVGICRIVLYNKRMKLKTFYAESIDGKLALTGQEFIHATKTFRLGVGDNINVICGDDYIYTCRISEVGKSEARLEIKSKELNKANPRANLTVYQCILKKDNIEFLIQRLTEVGAKAFVPVLSENVVKNDVNLPRIDKISIESGKQSGRSRLIEVKPVIKFSELINQISSYDLFVVAHEKEVNSRLSKLDFSGAKNVALLIGPEGGISDSEIESCAKAGAKVIGLGARVLRAETAGLALSSIILEKMGEFENEN